jgi:IS30 family transposase
MKGYEVAKELNVDSATVSRDIKYLTAESQKYLNDLARQTLPFMYQTSIEGIRSVMKECWNIYESADNKNNFQKLAALKLAKECHEAVFKLVDEGPSVMYLKQLQEKLIQIESRQIR